MENIVEQFLKEVEEFRRWAETVSKKNVDWEIDYLYWNRVYRTIDNLLAHVKIECWDTNLVASMLYILARDNECENILQILIERPSHLIYLATKALSYEDYNARWQLAHGLGQIGTDEEDAKSLLVRFSVDSHEYVRRRALNAFNNTK